jgi:hypothetical protein
LKFIRQQNVAIRSNEADVPRHQTDESFRMSGWIAVRTFLNSQHHLTEFCILVTACVLNSVKNNSNSLLPFIQGTFYSSMHYRLVRINGNVVKRIHTILIVHAMVSNTVITTLVYATPRLLRQIFCGTN